MLFQFENFAIDVDVEQTRKYYKETQRTLTEGCDCVLCKNFLAASKGLGPEIRDFFEHLGVDISKAPDMTTMHGDPERNILYYDGFYHLCGSVVDGAIRQEISQAPGSSFFCTPRYSVTSDCEVYFTTRHALVEKGFPDPVLEMEVSVEVPWVLGGKFTDALGW